MVLCFSNTSKLVIMVSVRERDTERERAREREREERERDRERRDAVWLVPSARVHLRMRLQETAQQLLVALPWSGTGCYYVPEWAGLSLSSCIPGLRP